MKSMAYFVPLSVLVLLAGCGGGGAAGRGGATPDPPQAQNITGNWQFGTTSTVVPETVATIAGSITHSGSSISGAVHIDGSPCFDRLTNVGLTGALTAGRVSLTSTSVDGQIVTITGNLTNNALTGTYAIDGGCANGDQGNVTGFKVPAIGGTWRMIFDVNEQHVGFGRAMVNQVGASTEGSFGLSGSTISSVGGGGDALCYEGTITPGTIPFPSFVIGKSVNIEIRSKDGTVVFVGTLTDDGSEITGHHQVVGGVCDGYFGGACLGRDLGKSCHVPPF